MSNTSRNTTRLAPGDALDDLTRRIAEACRMVRGGVPVMTEDESQLLSDFARGRNLVTLGKLLRIAQRAGRTDDALAISEAIRGHVLKLRDGKGDLLAVLAAFQEETVSNGAANEAQLQFVITPSRSTQEVAIETLARQEYATRAAIDALHRTDVSSTTRILRVG